MLRKLDKGILYTTLVLVLFGFFIFFSASLSGLKDIDFFLKVFFKQFISIIMGLGSMLYLANSKWLTGIWLRKNSANIFLAGLFLQILVLFPVIGLELKGAQRWIDLGFVTLQPSEFFKYALVIFFTATVVTMGKKIKTFKNFFKFSLWVIIPIPLFFIYINDFGTLMALIFSIFLIFILSEANNRNIIFPGLALFFIVSPIIYYNIPYVHDRLEVYINQDSRNIQDNFYQQHQMLITIGSGELFGRGFGGSLQKYTGRIPEPFGDSIFTVYSEEFGFAGSILLILLFLLLTFFILMSAKKIKNSFAKMVVVGLGSLLVFPAFYNIASSLAVVPLSGMPITFVSKGGSAILSSLIIVGVILALTRKKR